MRSALRLAGNRNAIIKLFPRADHDILIERRRYADGYLEYLVDWIFNRTRKDAPRNVCVAGPFCSP